MGKLSTRLAAALVPGMLLCACASASEPAFLPSTPTAVVGTVMEFQHGVSIVHFEHGSTTFDHVVVLLAQPREARGTRVGLLYQGAPIAAGHAFKIGDRVSFTMPPSDGARGYPWGIYLSELPDFRVLPEGT